jgi:hypothetical protein
MSKKINKKAPEKKKKPVKIKPVKRKLKWKGEPATCYNSVPWKDLPEDVKKALDPTYGSAATLLDDPKELAKESDPDYKGFKKSDFDAAIKASGQFTDDEIAANKDLIKTIDLNEFALKVEADEIPVDEMLKWVTCLLSHGSSKNSFYEITDKIFNFRLGQMGLAQLITLRHNIDKSILEMALPKKEVSPGDEIPIFKEYNAG